MAEITGPLSIGSQSESVKAVQTRLNQEPGNKLTLDGKFGMKTSQAVLKFQKAAGLSVDGVVGAKTAEKMGFAYKRMAGGTVPLPLPGGTPAPHVIPIPGGGGNDPGRDSEIAELGETVIGGLGAIVYGIVREIDNVDLVPDAVKERVRSAADGYVGTAAGTIRGVTRNIDWLQNDPLGYVYSRFHSAITHITSRLRSFLSQLTAIPGIGSIAQAYMDIVGRIDDILPLILAGIQGSMGNLRGAVHSIRARLGVLSSEVLTIL
jgi:peptidoglycan hydrolase-like protein with peptidoglycan-binding domain